MLGEREGEGWLTPTTHFHTQHLKSSPRANSEAICVTRTQTSPHCRSLTRKALERDAEPEFLPPLQTFVVCCSEFWDLGESSVVRGGVVCARHTCLRNTHPNLPHFSSSLHKRGESVQARAYTHTDTQTPPTCSLPVHGQLSPPAPLRGNDPSAGSPTETLLRLHLPLDGKI